MNDFELTGRIIKEAREAKGWTQLQLADVQALSRDASADAGTDRAGVQIGTPYTGMV